MSIAGPHAPLSPISVGGSDYFPSKGVPPPNTRANLASPPISGGSPSAIVQMDFPPGLRSNGGPSPPPSVGRSSIGTNGFAKRDSARSTRSAPIDENVLQEHYFSLRAFLQARDPNAVRQPNKARDKLQRLSSVQFYELSTDVFDELMRRQATARVPPNAPNAPPAYLLPKETFHPKRNQARQRLSSLGPPRFRDLAADVFHELERRFPRFQAGAIPRAGSSMSMRGGPMGPPGGPGFPHGGNRRPSLAGSMRSPAAPDGYIPPSPGMSPGEFGRPTPRQLNQNNTIIPNKSTMVEEDGADEEGDAFGLEGIADRESNKSASEADKKVIEDYQTQIRELQEKLEVAEETVKKTDAEAYPERLRELEDKLAEAQGQTDSAKEELERAYRDHEQERQSLRAELDELRLSSSVGSGDDELRQENEHLRASLREQQETTDQVRREAQEFLHEMRVLSQDSTRTYERQLELERSVDRLEQEVGDWRNRYARSKTQLRNMRASVLGVPMDHDPSKLMREKGFTDDNGMIKDIHVTKFQIAIDELLQTARREGPEKIMESMKLVVVAIRRITKDIDESTPLDPELAQQKAKLKGRLAGTANNLITASKNFAAGAGISPVSIVDAAASNLSAAVVELLRAVKIRPTPAEELEDDEGTLTSVDSTGTFSAASGTGPIPPAQQSNGLPLPPAFQGLGGLRASADSSAYSPMSSPRHSTSRGIPTTSNGNGVANGGGYMRYSKGPAATSNGYGHQDEALDPTDPSYWE